VAKRNYARLVGADPDDFDIAHGKDNAFLQPGEETTGKPERRFKGDKTGNQDKAAAVRKEAARRKAEAQKAGRKAWEETDPEKFARPSGRQLDKLRAAERAAAGKPATPNAAKPSAVAESPVPKASAVQPPKAVEPPPPVEPPKVVEAPPPVKTAPPEPPPVPKPSVPAGGSGPSAVEVFAGKAGSVVGSVLHVFAIKQLAETLERFDHPERYPEGFRFTDPIGREWIKFGNMWVNQAYLDSGA
jgi:hypothetical protein